MKNLFKIICLKKVKYAFFLIFLLFIYIIISAYSYTLSVSSNLSDSVFRLHVIANSDSQDDQELKLKVRDSLINYLNSISKECKSKDDVIILVKNHINDFYDIANTTIKDNGFTYNVNIDVGNFEFPTKTYGDISFPAGYYDALRVKIGDAKGCNWWCVMFPPLCFVNVTSGIVPDDSKAELENELSEEDYKIISSDSFEYKIKFKLVELFQGRNIITAKK